MKRLLSLIIASFLCLATLAQEDTIKPVNNPSPAYSFENFLSIGNKDKKGNAKSAWLEVGDSVTTKTIIIGRVTDTSAILYPKPGMICYSYADSTFYGRSKSKWVNLNGAVSGSTYTAGYGLDLTGIIFKLKETLRDSILSAARTRSTHTGTQAQSTVALLNDSLRSKKLQAVTNDSAAVQNIQTGTYIPWRGKAFWVADYDSASTANDDNGAPYNANALFTRYTYVPPSPAFTAYRKNGYFRQIYAGKASGTVYSVGGDVSSSLTGEILLTNMKDYSGDTTEFQSGFAIYDATPALIGNLQVSPLTGKKVKALGWWSGVTSYHNLPSGNSIQNWISFLSNRYSFGGYTNYAALYDNAPSSSQVTGKIWGVVMPQVQQYHWLGGKLGIGSKFGSASDLGTQNFTAGVSLELGDTNSVFLPNRISTYRETQLTLVPGMIWYNTDSSAYFIYDGTAKRKLAYSNSGSGMTYPGAGIPLSTGSAWGTSITDNSTNWNTAYTDRNKWDGGATGLTASTGRTSLGATTVGSNLFTAANPSAIRYIQINADNTVTFLDAAGMRTAIGAQASGSYLLQNGNSFSDHLGFGTNDNFQIRIKTNGTTHSRITETGSWLFNQASSFGDYKVQVTGGVYMDVTGKTWRVVGLGTENTATQVLARNVTGDFVLRDVSSISGLTVSGSPTVNTLSAFVNGTTLRSSLFFDNGTVGGFNTTSVPAGVKFQFNGTDGGLQIFRLTTTQRDALGSPPDYTMIQNTTTGKIEIFKSSTWHEISTDQELGSLLYDSTYDKLIDIVNTNDVKIKSIRVRAGANITVNKTVNGSGSSVDYEIVGSASGVASFNGRTGTVTPQAGDYNSITETLSNKDINTSNGNVLKLRGITMTASADGTGTYTFPTTGSNLTIVTTSSTQTLSNKRWVPRVGSTTSSATPTINTDNYDIYKLTAQAADITSFTTNLSGTPNDGDILEIQITGTAARAITWGSSFVASTVALPTTTVTTATLTVIFQYYTTHSSGNNKWVCVNSY